MSHGASVQLPERLEAAAGDVGEVERGGAGAANARRLAHDARQRPQILIDRARPSLNGKPVPISERDRLGDRRDGDRLAVAAARRRRPSR